jgi:hypothetical protein
MISFQADFTFLLPDDAPMFSRGSIWQAEALLLLRFIMVIAKRL